MLNKSNIYTLLDNVLKECKYHTVIHIHDYEEGLTRFANSEIHQNVFKSDTTAQVIILHDKKVSKISTNVITEESLRNTINEAEENLKYLPVGTFEYPINIDENEIIHEDYNEEIDNLFDVNKRSEILKASIDSIEENYTAAGILSLSNEAAIFANNHGTRRYSSSNEVTFSVVVTHKDGSDGFEEITSNNPEELDIPDLFKKAYETSKSGLNPISVEPGVYDVVLSPYALEDLLSFAGYIGVNSKAYLNNMSCFSGKLGEKVLGENITIKDNAEDPRISGRPFDFEGFKRMPLTLVENGVLKELPHDSKTASMLDIPTNGHSAGYSGMGGIPFSFSMDGGKESFSELIAGVKRGLLINCLHYTNPVDRKAGLITGLTRNGVFLIEDGKVVSPVKNMRFTDSLLNVFNNIDGLSETVSKVAGNLVPSARVRNFHITGKTS